MKKLYIAFMSLFCCTGAFARNQILYYYVDSSRDSSGEGYSWGTAFKELRDAFAVLPTEQSVVIRVAKGTYKPTATTNRDTSFVMLRGRLKLYGGYPSGGGTRNVTAYPTILSGDIGTVNNNADNSYHILVMAGIPAAADSSIIDGFTISRGNANGSGSKTYNGQNVSGGNGGGIALMGGSSSKIAIRNCAFTGGNANTGAGIYIEGGSMPAITNCIFSGNTALNYAGGVAIFNSLPAVLTNCTFSGNKAQNNAGGGMFISGSSPVITNCILWGNTAASGNAIGISGSTPVVSYSLVQDSYTGTGNLNVNPLFINASDPDGPDGIFGTADDGLRLQFTSPAINKGSNDAVPDGITTDIAGAGRIQGSAVDMGAYESLVTLYVDNSIVSAGNGGNWLTAYKELRDALAVASANPAIDSILVAKGTYKPIAAINRDTSFVLKQAGLKLYGGFPSGGGHRNMIANPTILSGDIGTVNNNNDNSYHVVVIAGIPAAEDSLIVDGFTIARGNANSSSSKTYNGQNVSRENGGGIALVGGSSSNIAIRNCTFTGDSAVYGGGLHVEGGSSPAITNCTFSGNKGLNYGGGISILNSASVAIANCAFSGNNGPNYGGGISILNSASAAITNCTFSGNSALNYGGGMSVINGSPAAIINCTFSGNTAQNNNGGALFVSNNSSVITNCILWGNTTSPGNAIYVGSGGAPVVTYSLVQGGYTGAGNLNVNPLFVNAAGPDGPDGIFGTADDGLRLQLTSPAINKGSNDAIPTGIITDITGAARLQGNAVDIGAYESPLTSFTTLYVDGSMASAGGGGTWASALKELRDALAAAALNPAIDSILVARGIYKPSATNQDTAFALLRGGLKLYGGYSPGGGTRNVTAYPTILSGDIGTTDDITDNSYHVLVVAGIPAAADSLVVDGFTISRGNASVSKSTKNYNGQDVFRHLGAGITIQGSSSSKVSFRNCAFNNNSAMHGAGGGMFIFSADYLTISYCTFSGNSDSATGGGIYMSSSEPVITNCRFINNTSGSGGGMYVEYSYPVINNCTFSGNVASYRCGGMYIDNSEPAINNCIFSGNSSESDCGGMYIIFSDAALNNCIFSNNKSDEYSGGMYIRYCNPVLTACTFSGNIGYNGGGGILVEGGSPTIANCTLTGNRTSGSGGGMNIFGSSTPTITNCVLSGNHATSSGGGIYMANSRSVITNCTLSGNNSNSYGGGMYSELGSHTITNCILWGNTAPNGKSIYVHSGAPLVTYNQVQGGFAGTGNLNANPFFINAADPDGADNLPGTADDGLRLQQRSLAINNGRNASVPATITTDITGAVRIQQGIVDRGAYESPYTSPTKLYVDNNIVSSDNGGTWATAFKELGDALAAAGVNPTVDSVVIAKGTYKPTSGTNRDSAIVITRGGLKIYGGYPNGGGVRNAALNPTILSGDIGTANNTADNSFHVLVVSNIPASADSIIIDGLTITKGNANGAGTQVYNGQTFNQDDGAGVSLVTVNNKTVFRSCVFSANVSTGSGGGILNAAASPSFFNCLIAGNKAQFGGGIFNYQASPVITNCTIAADTATGSGGGLYNNNSTPVITNSIIWGNTATNGGAGFLNSAATPDITYSIIQSAYSGTGNLNTDPLFINAATGNFQLQGCSPAINAGNSTAVPPGLTTDLVGNARIFNAAVDMGAYENVVLPTTFTFKGAGNWNTVLNWQCNWVPPMPFPSGSEIIIDPMGGDCILNVPFTVGPGGKLTVKTGKKLVVQGNFLIQRNN